MISSYNGSEPYIFVSYAHKDSAEVYGTIEKLASLGYRIWYDEGIKPGVEWPENIAEHLDQCSLFMMFISPNSMDSANCRREINFALSRSKQFLCIVLEKTEIPLGMELQLASQQSIFRYKYSSEKAYIYKICSAAGMAKCKDTHYFSEDNEHPARTNAKVEARALNEAVKPRVSSSKKSSPKNKDGKKNGKKNEKGSAALLGLLIGGAIIIFFLLFMLSNMGGADNKGANAALTPTLTITPTVTDVPSVTPTPAPSATAIPTPTEVSTQEKDDNSYSDEGFESEETQGDDQTYEDDGGTDSYETNAGDQSTDESDVDVIIIDDNSYGTEYDSTDTAGEDDAEEVNW